jgi:hypothetical protein
MNNVFAVLGIFAIAIVTVIFLPIVIAGAFMSKYPDLSDTVNGMLTAVALILNVAWAALILQAIIA